MKRMTNAEMDALVLEALRMIARHGTKARIHGKAVRQAAPRNGRTVYERLAIELAKDLGSPNLFIPYTLLRDCTHRLVANDLLFNHGGQATEDMTFWVVMN
jgi:hypothetical protein